MYRIKECVDEFEYKFKDSETGKIKKFKITETRIVTFNPKLAKKQIYEINKEVEKSNINKSNNVKNEHTSYQRQKYEDQKNGRVINRTSKILTGTVVGGIAGGVVASVASGTIIVGVAAGATVAGVTVAIITSGE